MHNMILCMKCDNLKTFSDTKCHSVCDMSEPFVLYSEWISLGLNEFYFSGNRSPFPTPSIATAIRSAKISPSMTQDLGEPYLRDTGDPVLRL